MVEGPACPTPFDALSDVAVRDEQDHEPSRSGLHGQRAQLDVVSVKCPSGNPKRPRTTRVDHRRNPLPRMGFWPNRLVRKVACSALIRQRPLVQVQVGPRLCLRGRDPPHPPPVLETGFLRVEPGVWSSRKLRSPRFECLMSAGGATHRTPRRYSQCSAAERAESKHQHHPEPATVSTCHTPAAPLPGVRKLAGCC